MKISEVFFYRIALGSLDNLDKIPMNYKETDVLLKNWLSNEGGLLAIKNASFNLHERCESWLKEDFFDKKTTLSVLSYYKRFHWRCTPFGLFSAIGIAKFSNKSYFSTKSEVKYFKKKYIYEEKLKINGYSYQIDSNLFFVNKSSGFDFSLELIEIDEYILSLIEYVQAPMLKKIVKKNFYEKNHHLDFDDIDAYIEEVIQSGLIQNFKFSPINPLPEEISLSKKTVYSSEVKSVQIDSFSQKKILLDSKLKEKIELSLSRLFSFTSPKNELINITNFISENYDSSRLPLTQIFSPMNDAEIKKCLDLDLRYSDSSFSSYEKIIINEMVNKGPSAEIIDIDFSDEYCGLKGLNRIPFDLSVLCSLYLDKNEDANIHLKAISSPGGMKIISRFAYLSEDICLHSKQYSKKVESFYDNFIVAEVLYYPHEKSKSVINRPKDFDYCIPLFCPVDGFESEYIIEPRDISISLISGRIYLWSEAHQRPILPRITSAHSFKNSENLLYRFLGMFQSYQFSNVNLYLSKLKNVFNKIPRIIFKDIILSEKCWRLNNDLIKNNIESLARLGKPSLFFGDNHSRVVFKEGDNHLIVNLTSIPSCESLLKHTSSISGEFWVYEDLTESFKSPIKLKGKAVNNEFLFPIYNHESEVSYIKRPLKSSVIDSCYDDGLYRGFKQGFVNVYIYGSFPVLEKILVKLRNELSNPNMFFIRYFDGVHQFRLRFLNITPEKLTAIDEYIRGLVKKGRLNKYIYKPFRPEVLRYGGLKTYEMCEDLFIKESDLVVSFLDSKTIASIDERFELAVIYSLALLDNFDSSVANLICDMQIDYYSSEFGSRVVKNKKFTKYSRKIVPRLTDLHARSEYTRVSLLLIDMANISKSISADFSIGEYRFNQVVASLIHMFCNRVFLNDCRLREYELYAIIKKIYIRKNKSCNI